MQCLKIKISETSRSRIGVILFLLNTSILLVCHATGAMGILMRQEVSSVSDFLVFYNTSSLFRLLFCLSLLVLVFHLIGAKICYDNAFYETRERFHSVLFYWLLAGCALVPMSVAAIIVLTAHQDLVLHAISLGFKHAMTKYKIDPAMREYINRLQIEHQCCGSSSVSDWFKVSWVDTSNAAPISHLANSRYMETNGEFLPRWAPFSCCRQDFIGAPCESVWMFFNPIKNYEWVNKSRIYSIDYLSQYDKYKTLFKNVSKTLHDPPEAMLSRGQRTVSSRRATFETFLRGVTGHSDAAPPARPPVDGPAGGGTDGADSGDDAAVLRTLFEAQGVRAQSLPESVLVRLGRPPWTGRVVWTYDNISTAESGNLDQLLRLDGKNEAEILDLLRWRSFNQVGCAGPIGHNARVTMHVSSILFICVAVAQLVILILGRYLQTSIDTAYRWGNPLLSAPGFLFGTSHVEKPQDEAELIREGKRAMASLTEDIDEDDFAVLLAPSWTSAESAEESSVDDSALSESADLSGSSAASVPSESEQNDVIDGSPDVADTAVAAPDRPPQGGGEAKETTAVETRPAKVAQNPPKRSKNKQGKTHGRQTSSPAGKQQKSTLRKDVKVKPGKKVKAIKSHKEPPIQQGRSNPAIEVAKKTHVEELSDEEHTKESQRKSLAGSHGRKSNKEKSKMSPHGKKADEKKSPINNTTPTKSPTKEQTSGTSTPTKSHSSKKNANKSPEKHPKHVKKDSTKTPKHGRHSSSEGSKHAKTTRETKPKKSSPRKDKSARGTSSRKSSPSAAGNQKEKHSKKQGHQFSHQS